MLDRTPISTTIYILEALDYLVLTIKFRVLRDNMNTEIAILVFKQAVMPKFDYCSFLLKACTEKLKGDIQKVQNRFLRTILKVKVWDESVINLHKLCEAPTQSQRRKELLTTLMYRKSKQIPQRQRPARTRNEHKNNFKLKRPKYSFYKKGPAFTGGKLWNALPLALQQAESKFIFKKKIKNWYGTNLKGLRKAILNGDVII